MSKMHLLGGTNALSSSSSLFLCDVKSIVDTPIFKSNYVRCIRNLQLSFALKRTTTTFMPDTSYEFHPPLPHHGSGCRLTIHVRALRKSWLPERLPMRGSGLASVPPNPCNAATAMAAPWGRCCGCPGKIR